MTEHGEERGGRADDPGTRARVVLRPIGVPLPLGFLALAVETTLFGALQLGWIPPGEHRQVGVALVALALLQGVAVVFGFLARDSIVPNSMGILFATWLALGVELILAPLSGNTTLGILFLAAAASLLVSSSAAVLGKVLIVVVLGLTAARFVLTGVALTSGSPAWETAGGWTGIVLGGLALYAAVAFELESVEERTLLPTLRQGGARLSMTGTLDDELRGVEHEPGVRKHI